MNQTITIPTQFANRMVEMKGEDGQEWLANLPAVLEELAERWQLTLHSPFQLSYNYVLPVTKADGTTAVLKIGYPTHELRMEMEALRLYDGNHICKLLNDDTDHCAMLLEHIQPGQPLWSLQDDEVETTIAAQMMQQLWLPILPEENSVFPTLERWTRALLRLTDYFDDGFGPFPKKLVETAVSLRADLLADNIQPVLLHGDFHHENLLTAQRQPWLALDPKGVTGDPAYEVGAYLYNPLPEFVVEQNIITRRIHIFGEILDIDRQRLIAWGIVQAVLSAVWSYEDRDTECSPTLLVADILTRVAA